MTFSTKIVLGIAFGAALIAAATPSHAGVINWSVNSDFIGGQPALIGSFRTDSTTGAWLAWDFEKPGLGTTPSRFYTSANSSFIDFSSTPLTVVLLVEPGDGLDFFFGTGTATLTDVFTTTGLEIPFTGTEELDSAPGPGGPYHGSILGNLDTSEIPEPAPLSLLVVGLLGLSGLLRAQRRDVRRTPTRAP